MVTLESISEELTGSVRPGRLKNTLAFCKLKWGDLEKIPPVYQHTKLKDIENGFLDILLYLYLLFCCSYGERT